MTRSLRFSFLVFVLGFFSLAPLAKAQSSFWWHALLTQSGRNDAILQTALSYPAGTYFTGAGECKGWVQVVVSKASRGIVWLPQNDPYCLYKWLPSNDVQIIASDSFVAWWNFKPGQIIQAQIGMSIPHTMIVQSTNAFTISVVDCNWGRDNIIRRRTIDWYTFNRQVTHFTLYQVK